MGIPGPVPGVEFFGLRASSGPAEARRFSFPLVPALCSGTGALFGGAAIGAVAAMVEAHTGRTLVWASVQFVGHARPPGVIDTTVETLARGRRATQVRVTGRGDGGPVFAAACTAGERDPLALIDLRITPPTVPEWHECPPRQFLPQHRGTFHDRTDVRVVPLTESVAEGHSAVWARVPGLESGTSTLAVLGDYVPFGLRQAIGEGFETHSLDNTLRVLQSDHDGWVLVDVAIAGVAGGFGHGRVHLWDQARRLLGTASQSFTFRPR